MKKTRGKFKRRPNGKTLLFIGGPDDSLPSIGRAWALGYDVLVLDGNDDAPGRVWSQKMCGKKRFWYKMKGPPPEPLGVDSARASVYSLDEIMNMVWLFLDSGYTIDGVLACATDVGPIVSQVAEVLELPHVPEAITSLSWDKEALKEKLRAGGVPVPGPADFVIKPRNGRGGQGVRVIVPYGDYFLADHLLKENADREPVMYERFIHGPQISAEALFWEGEMVFCGYTDRDYSNGFPIECGGWGPSKYDCPPWGLELDATVYKVAQAVGLESGSIKLDLVMDADCNDRPTVIEAAIGRLSGGYMCSHYLPLAYGVDFLSGCFKVACGEDPRPVFEHYTAGHHALHVRGFYKQAEGATQHKERGPLSLRIGTTRRAAEEKMARE